MVTHDNIPWESLITEKSHYTIFVKNGEMGFFSDHVYIMVSGINGKNGAMGFFSDHKSSPTQGWAFVPTGTPGNTFYSRLYTSTYHSDWFTRVQGCQRLSLDEFNITNSTVRKSEKGRDCDLRKPQKTKTSDVLFHRKHFGRVTFKPSLGQPRVENRMTHGCNMWQFNGDRVLGAAVSLIAMTFVGTEVSVGIENLSYWSRNPVQRLWSIYSILHKTFPKAYRTQVNSGKAIGWR